MTEMTNNSETGVLTERQKDLIKQTIMPKAGDLELQLFYSICKKTQLDPFSKQIYAVERRSKNKQGVWSSTWTYQASIDGLRLVAQRSGRYQGQTPVYWYSRQHKKWVDVWDEDVHPIAAKVGVYIKGNVEPTWAVAHYKSYVQKKKDDNKNEVPTLFWRKMPEIMISKCAEALALRKAFPQELSGIYSSDEIQQDSANENGKREITQKKNAQKTVIVEKKETVESKKEEWPSVDEFMDKQAYLKGTFKMLKNFTKNMKLNDEQKRQLMIKLFGTHNTVKMLKLPLDNLKKMRTGVNQHFFNLQKQGEEK